MVRMIVCSDSHNNYFALEAALQAHPEAELLLHLGDGEREFDDLAAAYPQRRMVFVRGNCDWSSPEKPLRLLMVGGRRILMTHGHLFGVKQDVSRLLEQARQSKAELCCFGHTHTSLSSIQNGIHLLNPGSLTHPRNGPPTYGLVELTEQGISARIISLQQVVSCPKEKRDG